MDVRAVVAKHVDVFIAVDIPEAVALAAIDADRERRIVSGSTRATSRHHARHPLKQPRGRFVGAVCH